MSDLANSPKRPDSCKQQNALPVTGDAHEKWRG